MQNEVCVAVDFGGTKLMIGAVTREGEILASKIYKTGFLKIGDAGKAVLSNLDSFIKYDLPDSCKMVCIGMGVVGQINYKQGVWEKLYEINSDEKIPITDIVRKKYRVPCGIDNDVKAALAAERRLGIGKNSSNFIYVNVGTGIAAGVVCDGRVLRGYENNAGEIGYFPAKKEEGCKIEDIASGRGIINQFRRYAEESCDKNALALSNKPQFTVKDLFDLAEKKNIVAEKILNDAADELANMCEHLIYTYSPEQIVFGGGVMNCGQMLRQVKDRIKAVQYGYKTEIRLTQLELKTIGLIGAAMIGFEWEERV